MNLAEIAETEEIAKALEVAGRRVFAAQVRRMDAEICRMRETLEGIANADWRKWEELASPEEFVRWAKSRATHALASDKKDDEKSHEAEPSR